MFNACFARTSLLFVGTRVEITFNGYMLKDTTHRIVVLVLMRVLGGCSSHLSTGSLFYLIGFTVLEQRCRSTMLKKQSGLKRKAPRMNHRMVDDCEERFIIRRSDIDSRVSRCLDCLCVACFAPRCRRTALAVLNTGGFPA